MPILSMIRRSGKDLNQLAETGAVPECAPKFALLSRRRAAAARRFARLLLRSAVGDPPDRAAGIVGHQQRTVLSHRERCRPAPHFGALNARCPEAHQKVLVRALEAAILE